MQKKTKSSGATAGAILKRKPRDRRSTQHTTSGLPIPDVTLNPYRRFHEVCKQPVYYTAEELENLLFFYKCFKHHIPFDELHVKKGNVVAAEESMLKMIEWFIGENVTDVWTDDSRESGHPRHAVVVLRPRDTPDDRVHAVFYEDILRWKLIDKDVFKVLHHGFDILTTNVGYASCLTEMYCDSYSDEIDQLKEEIKTTKVTRNNKEDVEDLKDRLLVMQNEWEQYQTMNKSLGSSKLPSPAHFKEMIDRVKHFPDLHKWGKLVLWLYQSDVHMHMFAPPNNDVSYTIPTDMYILFHCRGYMFDHMLSNMDSYGIEYYSDMFDIRYFYSDGKTYRTPKINVCKVTDIVFGLNIETLLIETRTHERNTEQDCISEQGYTEEADSDL